MTISSQTTSIIYPGNGSQTTFTFNFQIPSDSAGNAQVMILIVNSNGTNASIPPSAYTITGLDNPAGGVITYPLSGLPLQAGQQIVIERAVPYTQLVAVSNQAFYPHTLEQIADTLTFETQQLAEVDARTLQFLPGDTGLGFLPPVALRKGLVLGFDPTTGAPIAVTGGSGGGGSSAWSALTGVPAIISAIDVITPVAGQILEFTGPTTAHLITTPVQNFNYSALAGVPGAIAAISAASAPASGQIFEYLSATTGHFIATPGGGGGGGITGPGTTHIGSLVTWNSVTGAAISDPNIIPSANGYSLISAANYAAMRGLLGIGAVGLLADVSTIVLAGSGLAAVTVGGATTLSYAGATPSPNSWNPADKTSAITLSGSNEIATATANSIQGVRGTTSQSSGAVYFEMTCSAMNPVGGSDAYKLCGLADIGYGLTSGLQPGDQGGSNTGFSVWMDKNGVGIDVGGTIFHSGGSSFNTGWIGATRALTWQFAVDLTNRLLWIKPAAGTGSTTWNNSGTADPATGAGGISFVGGVALYPVAAIWFDNGGAITVNTGASAFAGSPPAGFTAWDSAVPAAGVTSVNGRGGVVTLTAADVSTGFGAAVGGALAAGSGISLVTSGGVTTVINTGGGGGGGVTTFNGRAGAVALGVSDLAGLIVAGANVTVTNTGSALSIASSGGGGGGGVPISYYGAAENSITPANSAATNVANLNALISTVNAAGGGTIWFNGAGAYNINGQIILKSNVSIMMATGANLTWTGSTSGGAIMVGTSITDVVVNCKWELNLDEGTAFNGTMLYMHSFQYCDLSVEGLGTNTTDVFAQMFADSTAGQHPGGGRNTVFNRIRLRHHGEVGTGLIYTGLTSGFGGGPQGFTDNTFYDMQFNNVTTRGIKGNEWADSNVFNGNTYIGLSGANSIGVIINEGRTNNFTIYDTYFDHIAVDIFGSVGGRIGVVFQESEGMVVDQILIGPTFEGGSFIGSNCTSYQVGEQVNTGSTVYTGNGGPAPNAYIYNHQKNVMTGL